MFIRRPTGYATILIRPSYATLPLFSGFDLSLDRSRKSRLVVADASANQSCIPLSSPRSPSPAEPSSTSPTGAAPRAICRLHCDCRPGQNPRRRRAAPTCPFPPNARILDCTGKYLIPGLIDGFAGMNSQGQANAFLYMGVTTVVASADQRRGPIDINANPKPAPLSPRLHRNDG